MCFNWDAPKISLAWPDDFRAGRYRLEMISARAKRSGLVHS